MNDIKTTKICIIIFTTLLYLLLPRQSFARNNDILKKEKEITTCNKNSLYIKKKLTNKEKIKKNYFTNINDAFLFLKKNKHKADSNISICLYNGFFFIPKTIELSKDDFLKNNKITITNTDNSIPIITGSRKINKHDIHKLTQHDKLWNSFNHKLRNNISYIKLRRKKNIRINDINISVDNIFLQPARWPNKNTELYEKKKIFHINNTIKELEEYGFTHLRIDKENIKIDSKTIKWHNNKNMRVNGFVGNYWYYESIPGRIIDKNISITSKPRYKPKNGMPIYFSNIPEELDLRNEFYFDKEENRIYFFNEDKKPKVRISINNTPLFKFNNISNIIFMNIKFEYNAGPFIDFKQSNNIIINNVEFNYTNNHAIYISGYNNIIDNCKISYVGKTGIIMTGGNRSSLIKGNNVISNCEISNFSYINYTYNPGILLRGVGNQVKNNYIHTAPHSAIIFSGNNHTIEYNLIENVAKLTNDAGAIYVGRDLGFRGNKIKYNWINNINSIFGRSHAIYLDDGVSGISVKKNIISNINGYAFLNGGGRDNKIENNIIYNISDSALYTDRRLHSKLNNKFISNDIPDSWNLIARLKESYYSQKNNKINHKKPPWSLEYPELAKFPLDYQKIKREKHWLNPEGTTFINNIILRSSKLITNGSWGGKNSSDYFKSTNPNIFINKKTHEDFLDIIHLKNNKELNKFYKKENINIYKIGINK